MKPFLIFFTVFAFSSGLLGQVGGPQNKKKEEPEEDYHKLFSVEGSHSYNTMINKNGANVKFYLWPNKTYNFGPEFHWYFPTTASPSADFQLDFNFRKILVNFHPITFDVLVGPGFRNAKDSTGTRVWNFDGVTLGFGVAYRYKNISLFVMPKITHIDPSLQVSTGIKYHFDIPRFLRLKNRYRLNKV